MGLFGFSMVSFSRVFSGKVSRKSTLAFSKRQTCQFSCVSSTIPKGLCKFQTVEPLPIAGEGQEVAALQPDKDLGAWEEKVPEGKQATPRNEYNALLRFFSVILDLP